MYKLLANGHFANTFGENKQYLCLEVICRWASHGTFYPDTYL